MWLKRIYDQSKLVRDDKGNVIEVLPGAVQCVRIEHAGPIQKFTPQFAIAAGAEGWLRMENDRILLEGEGGVIVYKIVRLPGIYCCFDDTKHASSADAHQYVEGMYPGLPSPDHENPRGYRTDDFFYCERED